MLTKNKTYPHFVIKDVTHQVSAALGAEGYAEIILVVLWL
jgi:hypothetical protein